MSIQAGRCPAWILIFVNLMPELKISLFGTPSIRVDEIEFDTDRRKSVALLAYLIETGREPSREQLANLFWPDYPRESTFSYLRRTLWELNKGLGKGWIQSEKGRVGFNFSAGAEIDTVLFQREKMAAETADDPIPGLEKARALYTGDFLADFFLQDAAEFEDWQRLQSENYRREYAGVLESLADRYNALGEWEKALESAQAWLLLDTINEIPHRLLMRIYDGKGDRAGVVRQYESCRAELLEQVGLEPEPETTALYERLVQGGPDEPIPVETLPNAVSAANGIHLPTLTTPFIGRRHEVERIKDLILRPENRLVTLVGPGGGGKTRLAIQSAAETGARFPDGVWFVPLAPVVSPEDIIPILARSLNFNFYREEERPRRQLLDYLGGKDLLLALDNLEQLVGPETNELFGEILAESERVKLLVTSRTRLNLPGEQLYAVGGMQLPGPEQAAGWVDPAAEAERFSALGLFMDRARRVRPEFALTPENVLAVVETCRLVAGMPLGIELAASWLELLGPDEIAAEIRRSLDFLETDQPGVPERQRSMRAVFDYSWKMLNEIEKEAFLALTVFSGGFTREAGQEVSGASLRTLLSLANKSWLQQVEGSRFQLHPLLMHYGSQWLAENRTALRAAGERHALYYARFLEGQSVRMEGPEQYDAAADLDHEFDTNIRAAWDWLVEQGRWDVLLDRMVLGLLQFSSLRWNSDALISWMRSARERLDPENDDLERLAFAVIGTLEVAFEEAWSIKDFKPEERLERIWRLAIEQDLVEQMGFWFVILAAIYDARNRESGASAYLRRAIDGLRARGSDWQLGVSLLYAGNAWDSDQSRIDEKGLEEAWEIFERRGVIYEKAIAIEQMGVIAKVRNRRIQDAIEAFEKAQDFYRRVGDRMGVAGTYFHLAALFEHRPGFDRFVEYRREQRRIYEPLGKLYNIAFSYHWEAMIAARYGSFEHALFSEQSSRKSIERFGADRRKTWMAWSWHQLGEIYRIFGRLDEARAALDLAQEAFSQLKYDLGLGYVRRAHGDMELAAGHFVDALAHYEAYMASAVADNHTWSIAEAHTRLAWAHARLGDIPRARAEIGASLVITVNWNEPDLEILALLGEAYCLAGIGEKSPAVELLTWIAAHPHTWNETIDLANALLDELGAKRPVMPDEFPPDQLDGSDVRRRTESWLEQYPTHSREAVI